MEDIKIEINDIGMEREVDLMPTVALRGLSVRPDLTIHFDLNRKKSIAAVEQAMMSDQNLFLITQRDPSEDDPDQDELYTMGCVAKIKQITRLPENMLRVMVEGTYRAQLVRLHGFGGMYLASEIRPMPALEHLKELRADEYAAQIEEEAMIRALKEQFTEYQSYFPRMNKNILTKLENGMGFGSMMDYLIENIHVEFDKKQAVLEAWNLDERFEVLMGILQEENQIASIRQQIAEKVKAKVDKSQKEYYLREQMGVIREELGESGTNDADQYEAKLKELKCSDEVREKIQKEIRRFRTLGPSNAESSVSRGYIETLLELPWEVLTEDRVDVDLAEEILDRDHYGLQKVKERILEVLAVRALTGSSDSSIICLVGPPGTGKTSIARSVAEAMNRKYVRICLGGVRDEAEIRGHRRTYIGSMPGRIVDGLKQAGVRNPLMLLDEIDKVSSDYKGDTSSALLEVLDSEQNSHFRDHYVEVPMDLSQVFFIATANNAADIPKPLLDRMELIELSGYTGNEKFHIAKDHLLPRELQKNGMNDGSLAISDGALKRIIEDYTVEAGVRTLERRIGQICRKAARQVLKYRPVASPSVTENPDLLEAPQVKPAKTIRVSASNLEKYLGQPVRRPFPANKEDMVGIVRGLAWTSVGGVTLEVEVNTLPGKGDVKVTGQLGDVMKESAQIGYTYMRSAAEKYGISADAFSQTDVHIHIPEGATPKDGPSAGITMATAMISAFSNRPVHADVAMTGEVTLRGRVLPIGGLKEKLLAAKVAGIKRVLVPVDNERDLKEISEEITEGMEVIPVRTMDEVLSLALAETTEKE